MSDRTLQPRTVSPDSLSLWIREAWRLLCRRPLSFFAVSWIACLLVGFLPQPHSLVIAVILWPLVLAAFALVASAADHGQALDPLEVFRQIVPNTRALLTLAVVSAAAVAVLWGILLLLQLAGTSLLSLWTGKASAEAAVTARHMAPWKHIAQGAFTAFIGLVIGANTIDLWFAVPLILNHGADPLEAWSLSRKADRINPGPLRLLAATAIVFSLVSAILFAIPSLIGLPFLGAVLYVAYRDIFLGRAENAPAKETVEVWGAVPDVA